MARGASLVSILIAISIFSAMLLAAVISDSRTQQRTAVTISSVVANAYASELLELFRAHSNLALNTYLGSLGGGSFPLCQKMNELDRVNSTATSAVYLRPVPLANLPPNVFMSQNVKKSANRYFKVQIIDITTMVLNTMKCGSLPPYSLGPNERFLVSAGVSWVTPKDEEKAVTLSSVLTN